MSVVIFKKVGICVVKKAIEKGTIHYTPNTVTTLGDEYIYMRKYSKFQKKEKKKSPYDEVWKTVVPDRVLVFYKNGDLLYETNDVALEYYFTI